MVAAVSSELVVRLSLVGRFPWRPFPRESSARPGSEAGTCPVVRVDGARSVSKEALPADGLPPGTETPRADSTTDSFCWCFLKVALRKAAIRKPDALSMLLLEKHVAYIASFGRRKGDM